MDYNEFIEEIRTRISVRLAEGYDIDIKQVMKNNDICYYGLSAFLKNEKKKVSKIIYL